MKKLLKLALITVLVCLSHIIFVNTAVAQAVLPEACNTPDVDDDSNGLIEICHLEDLDAMRFVLDGSSYQADSVATTSTLGCPSSGCVGYELVRDLDFDDDASYSSTANKVTWTTGEGWQPIGVVSAFSGQFEGNSYTISNLYINSSGTLVTGLRDIISDLSDLSSGALVTGLFGYTGSEAEIANVGLLNVNITGRQSVGVRHSVGSLVGWSDGRVTNSYATGSVTGTEIDDTDGIGGLVGLNRGTITDSYATSSVIGDSSRVGGLVGWNFGTITDSYATGFVSGNIQVGGLVGYNFDDSTIANSYATGSVSGNEDVGGLVGLNGTGLVFLDGGTITNSYATGSVSGDIEVGGLVGFNHLDSAITNSYATGFVLGFSNVGGLVGNNDGGTITDSYWDINTSGITTSDGGTSKTTVELQSPTAATGIYSSWDPDVWDFGTPTQYPIGVRHTNAPRSQPLRLTIRCAAFFPNIGQTELFFEIRTNGIDVNDNGFTIDGHTIESVEPIGRGRTTNTMVLKATLNEEIVDADSISVSYKPTSETPDDEANGTTCSSSSGLFADSDGDGIEDVADSNPFDENGSSINTNVASPTPIAEAPTTSTVFYSHDTVIRSLLRGEEFTYIDENEQGEYVRQTFTEGMAMTPAQYFGINDPAARIFLDVDSDLYSLYNSESSTRPYHLNRIRIAEHHTDVTDSFGDEPVGQRYYEWATVDNNGYLTSRFLSFYVEILPEINFSGQASYLYINSPSTPQTVAISTYEYGSSGSLLSQVQVQRGRIGSEDTTPSAVGLTNNELTSIASIAEGKYTIATSEYPRRGETITHWLDTAVVDREGATLAWHPAVGLEPMSGGVIQDSDDDNGNEFKYAIGPNNDIDVRVAARDEEITRIRQVQLYEIENLQTTATQAFQVSSVVAEAGRTYYVIADFEASTDTVPIMMSVQMLDGYTITETTSTAIEAIRNRGGVVSDAIIPFTVSDDTMQLSTQISVGWDRIGSAENIIETYLVTTDAPINYREPDMNRNNIPDNVDLNLNIREAPFNRLQAGANINNDYLSTQGDRPVFLTYEALVIANDMDEDARMMMVVTTSTHYSAANIDYGGLSDPVKQTLFDEERDTRIERLAAFGIREVNYQIDDNNEVIGGITHTVFPMSSDNPGETLYIGKYDRSEERWERFERGTFQDDDGTNYPDTWHGIPRPDNTEPCPTNVEVYKNEHQEAGEEGQGFVASAQNCIMLVITDGGPYDSSGLDGQVVDDMVATVNEPLVQTPQMPRGSGGGATDIGDVILLLVALSLLAAITIRRTRKNTTDTNQK